ncbi:sensory box protein [Asticcacaulis biprosthecium C19]|uniref:histidine kinase n=1 Tax=Asticcacaulis biprosthecium C19 TaxID=715226 RepID=F4QLI5_9CAUL|nr:ATP-binding protein [Asticcacaulis biprosthecium]EGF93483.1 sensory box protein [Asticcacaulis biprosthecium C19]
MIESAAADLFRGDSETAALMRERDWSQTSLGPVSGWPQSLKTAVRIMLTSRQPIWIGWGRDLVFLYNDPYKSIIGGKHPYMLGQPTSVVWAEIWEDIGPMLATAMGGSEGTYVEEQLLIMERNGYPEETYYTFSYSPIPDDDGTPGGIICANTEDTHRVIGDRQVALRRDLAAALTQARTVSQACTLAMGALGHNTHDLPFALIYVPDGEDLVLAGTSGIARGHAAAPARLAADKSIWPLSDSGDSRLIADLRGRLDLPSGAWPVSPDRAVMLPIATGGENAGVLITGLNPYRLYDEDYKGFMTLVTGQIAAGIANAQAYEDERSRAEALAELDRAKTAFFSNVSHEFRTPLTLLLAPLEEVLADPATTPRDRERLDVANRNALRLLKLVNVLLDFSRIEAGRTQAAFQPVNLACYTAELASNFRSAMDRAGLAYKLDIQPLSQPVYADVEMWEKVVLNLISNAFKYTLEGEVEISLSEADGHAVLAVRDTGPGIPEHERAHVFTRFHRVEGVTGRSIEGSGIGLALVRELVRLHGGEVWLKSETGRGSTFFVRLPLGTAHLPADQVRDDLATPGSRRAEAYVEEALRWLPRAADDVLAVLDAPAIPRPRVVLADDNADMRDYIHRLLNDDFDVVAVTDGEQAWQAIRDQLPELVLTDVMMPKLDGFGLLERLRGDDATRRLPVIMLSARAGEEARVEALDAGVDDYLVKPFNARELLAKVRSQLQIAHLRREGEAQVRRVLESIRDGIMVIERDWRITYMNGAGRDIIAGRGVDPEAIIGLSHWDAFPHAAGTFVEDHLRRAMEDRVMVEFENFYAPWQRWFAVRVYPVDEGGVSIYFHDITDRKEADAALRISQERWHGLAESMPQLVWIAPGQDAGVSYLNEQWAIYTGRPIGELINEGWVDNLHPDDRQPMFDTWNAAVAAEGLYDIEYRLRRFDGGYRWFKTRGVPVREASGRLNGWYGTCTDIQDMVEARVAAESANRAKSEFLANMSHEIRTPLNAIVGLTHIMLNYKTDPASHGKYLQTMKDSADTLMQLINDVLDLARIEADRVELEMAPCPLHEVVRECLGITEVKGAEKGLACGLDFGLPHGTVVETDVLRLKQILMNLLSNAVKFTQTGRIDVEVSAAPARSELLPVTIRVRDTGVGIAADKIEHIFAQFTQEDASITRRFGGSGLGLAISRRLSEMLGGRLTVESEVGKGTVFSLSLALKMLEIDHDKVAPPATERSEPARRRVLLAEDHPANALVATTLLEDYGYDCEVVPDGGTAIARWRTSAFDLVMMDVQMPDMDGYEATRQIRRIEVQETRPRTPILAMTAHALKGDRETCLQAGMDDYIAKPFDAAELEQKLRALLAHV